MGGDIDNDVHAHFPRSTISPQPGHIDPSAYASFAFDASVISSFTEGTDYNCVRVKHLQSPSMRHTTFQCMSQLGLMLVMISNTKYKIYRATGEKEVEIYSNETSEMEKGIR